MVQPGRDSLYPVRHTESNKRKDGRGKEQGARREKIGPSQSRDRIVTTGNRGMPAQTCK